MPASIGHNSAAYGYGPQGAAPVESILPDDHKKLFHYAKWHLGDYITGTQGMSLEYEGAYMRFLVRLYDRGKPFPDDDRFMATIMGLSLRVWRRIRDALVTVGKIVCLNGALTNSRFERERQKRAEELRKQADAALKRWERERQNRKTSAKFEESFNEVCPKVSANISKKSNEINEIKVTTHMPPRVQSPESIEEEKIQSPDGLLSPGSRQSAPPDVPRTVTKAVKLVWEMYNETAKRIGLSEAKILNTKRASALKERLKEAGGGQSGVDTARQALANIEKSAFCLGNNDRGWKVDFDYFVSPKGFVKLFEGAHGNGAHAMHRSQPQVTFRVDDIPDAMPRPREDA